MYLEYVRAYIHIPVNKRNGPIGFSVGMYVSDIAKESCMDDRYSMMDRGVGDLRLGSITTSNVPIHLMLEPFWCYSRRRRIPIDFIPIAYRTSPLSWDGALRRGVEEAKSHHTKAGSQMAGSSPIVPCTHQNGCYRLAQQLAVL